MKRTTELTQLIEEVADLAAAGLNTRCVFDFTSGLLYADVDGTQLTQAIRKIIQGAAQAMASGDAIKVSAETAVWPEEGSQIDSVKACVRLTFAVAAPGSWAQNLKKYFNTEFAVPHDTIRFVDSRAGIDTAIHIYLPLVSLPADPREELMDDSNYLESYPLETGRGRILVMDDEAFIRELADEMLTTLGYETVLVNNGEEAVAAYKAAHEAGKRFDIVILDLTVHEGMGGLEAMERLVVYDPDVKAIVSSGYSNDPVMSDYHSYGFQLAVQKPYRVYDMDRALKRLLH